eukprot:TRINITY_DN92898_c0_g1_i1.p1 TRINITY_DN92898_c0_g1~~TRINITY_DN92898_c0_g1_i1.p1  ORF type:complete len:606 (-),score=48.04 TRINITY_DN92898_c0_g1_i1:8-1795(-)
MACVWLLLCTMSAAAEEMVTLHRRNAPPPGWTVAGPAHLEMIEFSVVLRSQGVSELEAAFRSVTDPQQSEYGKYWNLEKIRQHVTPTNGGRVLHWLRQHEPVNSGLLNRGDAVHAIWPVSNVARAFNATLVRYAHTSTGTTIARLTGELRVPAAVANLIEFVTGISEFPRIRTTRRVPPWRRDMCFVDPIAIKRALALPIDIAANSTVTQGFAELGCQGEQECGFSEADLSKFRNLSTVLPIVSPLKYHGPGQPGPQLDETQLDVSMLAAVAQGAETWYIGAKQWLYDWAADMVGWEAVPKVLSLSWGWTEFDQCDPFLHSECTHLGVDPLAYVQRVDLELLKLGLRGVTVLVCSQDYGAPGQYNVACTHGEAFRAVTPTYPASSPYVTSVGATAIEKPIPPGHVRAQQPKLCKDNPDGGCCTDVPQTAAMPHNAAFSSGGGFSNFVAMPPYQQGLVARYLQIAKILPPVDQFNASGRAFPDVSALGAQILIVEGNVITPMGGTSAATPIIAGLVTLLNYQRSKIGKGPLGFLNPWLYSMASDPISYNSSFVDITTGNNTNGCPYGYGATVGWDAVSGLGAPLWPGWLASALRLP